MNKKIEKEIINGNYFTAYEYLKSCNYNYTMANLTHDFKKISSMQMYCFLMYAISRNETPEMHLAICDFLVFDPFFCYVYPMVYWHVKRILEIAPDFIDIKVWALAMYYQSPDSPFTESELYEFAKSILKEEPDNETALEIVAKRPEHI